MPSQTKGQATKASENKNQIKVRSEIEVTSQRGDHDGPFWQSNTHQVKICGPCKKCHEANAGDCKKCATRGMQAQDGSAYGWGGEELGGPGKESKKHDRFPFKKFPF